MKKTRAEIIAFGKNALTHVKVGRAISARVEVMQWYRENELRSPDETLDTQVEDIIGQLDVVINKLMKSY